MSSQQDTVLVCAVITILIIRLQLWITNYPQLGGGKLHIAHLLWGGLGMLLAIGLVLSYHGPKVRRAAAVLGGIGFGFFVDELGKFITSDNDYFFKPAAAIIYLLFLGLFFVTRWLRRRSVLTPQEALVNAVDMVKESALHDLDVRERRRALELLDRADPNDPLVEPLRRLMLELQSLPVRSPSRMTRWARAIRARYYHVIAEGWFPHVFRAVFVLVGIVSVVQVFGAVFDLVVVTHGTHIDISITRGATDFGKVSLYGWLNVAAVVVSTALLWIGVVRIGRDRLAGYIWIERSLLVSICVTQVFVFVQSQFTAVFGLVVDVILLVTVRAMIRAEHKLAARREEEAGAGTALPSPPAPPPEPAPEPTQEAPAPS
ncbi:MAG TPA: hypothetical protein VHR88_11330 [Solirubrobacteraceae bacterium]|nr:hypothetical protein [Solirubrobacteraceae bacterium]